MVTNYRLRSNSYTILDVRLWHGGRYICRAFNQAGSSHQAVVVKGKNKTVHLDDKVKLEICRLI